MDRRTDPTPTAHLLGAYWLDSPVLPHAHGGARTSRRDAGAHVVAQRKRNPWPCTRPETDPGRS
ncbi:hypothetical protein ABZO31_17605 [Streptomyces sp. HUAS MG47]|uniref:hypothetical protein n=1 Tax=Streptomyces solicamelliae TaxID=3231716 RepID=UPI003877DCEA